MQVPSGREAKTVESLRRILELLDDPTQETTEVARRIASLALDEYEENNEDYLVSRARDLFLNLVNVPREYRYQMMSEVAELYLVLASYAPLEAWHIAEGHTVQESNLDLK